MAKIWGPPSDSIIANRENEFFIAGLECPTEPMNVSLANGYVGKREEYQVYIESAFVVYGQPVEILDLIA